MCSSRSKITADGDCSHEIKRFLLLGRKVMTNLDSRSEERRVGKEWKQCQTLFFFFGRGGTKITADYGCSHENQRFLLLGRKVMTNLDSILKSRDIILPRMVRLVKAMVFPVVTYGCESWTIKKAECRRIDALELWLEKTLESPLD